MANKKQILEILSAHIETIYDHLDRPFNVLEKEDFGIVADKILALGKPEPLAKNKQNIEIDDRTFQFDVNCLTHEEQLRFKLLLNKGVIVKVLE